MDLINLLFVSFWFILPAYTANAMACIFGGGKPVDLNKNFIDQKRLIGNGVTYRGTFFGVFFGIVTAIIQYLVSNLGFKFILSFNFTLIEYVIIGFLLSFGALFGDMFGSFLKRRLGFKQGQSAPVLDQITFIVFALIFVSYYYLVPSKISITLLILSPVVHILSNIIAYKLGLKKVWW
ncbi:protein of unknown function DUF46 [Methanococcus vannielii SB]|uniref:CDP-archaeol synthase n=1 Tax=Methanococcus vannielii (strain ATCC 35089 / DSM 1224 / JCM 13029 / OCM 148 / SB) TaxID=406327 RepID=CDPAS_METVS|nr:CDP-2,3-bis-(O-geranylgeranyl)-sn-glycerol synthase [Methanococcus vannielii]A6UQY1.1 RecName: Full=CDP-archaeol synthase; AltName: Full=CDP-2,3-bis-(O-geranylgeranyl)-sn-glycerol synthase [Methanococcus vannielii SB]ABR54903.1 protein of unknown function DUF46 [Methanococcus vannielii SB]